MELYLVIITIAFGHTLAYWITTQPQIRWFLVHAFVNIVVAALSIANNAKTVDGNTCVQGNESQTPTLLAVAIHVYHCLFYKLSADDIFHHAIFVPLLGGIGLVWQWGTCLNEILFFACGLPGAIMYLLLAAQRLHLGWVRHINEPTVSMIIYTIIRMPGILFVCFKMIRATYETPPVTIVNIFTSLCSVNALFYGVQYYRRFLRKSM